MIARPPTLHLITGLRTGGAERALLRLVERGLARSFDTHVVSMDDEGTIGPRLRRAGAKVHTLGMRRNPISALNRLRTIVRTVRPGLIQGWMYHGNLAALIAARMAPEKVPVLWNVRQGLDAISAEKFATLQVIRLNSALSKLPLRIIYNSRKARLQHESYGFSSSLAEVIPNGFELDLFSENIETRTTLRRELGLGENTPLIGNFGRFHPVKDHFSLLTAANLALRSGLEADFLLAGNGISPDAVRLQTLVDPDFHHRFHIFGERSDIAAMMQAIDIYVSCSRAEAFPNVVGEAMASSVPCIGTNTGDTAFVIGSAGIVVPTADPGALADALLELGTDPARRRALGQQARGIIEQQFDIAAVVDRYINLYQSVLGTSGEVKACAES